MERGEHIHQAAGSIHGSATIPSESLNERFLIGPNLLPALVDIMLRWRKHRCVIAADIEKMYRQIMVHDRNLQRIVWRSDAEHLVEYRLNTVMYGLRSVLRLSGYCINWR